MKSYQSILKDNIYRLLRQSKIIEQIRNLKYSMFLLEKYNDGNLKNIIPLVDIGIHSDLNRCDYLLVPDDKLERIYEILK